MLSYFSMLPETLDIEDLDDIENTEGNDEETEDDNEENDVENQNGDDTKDNDDDDKIPDLTPDKETGVAKRR